MSDDRKCSKCKKDGVISYDRKWYCGDHKAQGKTDSNNRYIRLERLRNYGFPIIGITVGIIASIFAYLAYVNSI